MAFSGFLYNFDRLSVRSVMRGSTASVFGALGTFAVVILCLTIYLPPTINYLNGDYFESEFFHQKEATGNYYAGRDFKIAIQFRSRNDNSVANHTQILEWAFS